MSCAQYAFNNLGYLNVEVPDHLFLLLLKEAEGALDNNAVYESGLTDVGVAHHRSVESVEVLGELEIFVFLLIEKYRNSFYFDPSNTETLTANTPFVLGKPWINFQKQHEFVPAHYHEGVFSYSIWLKIPYESEGKYAGNFEFTYNSAEGMPRSEIIRPVEKQMLFFPSRMYHQVYPFYKNDDYRISVSGNVILEVAA